jgi:hypothetical protein
MLRQWEKEILVKVLRSFQVRELDSSSLVFTLDGPVFAAVGLSHQVNTQILAGKAKMFSHPGRRLGMMPDCFELGGVLGV